MRWKLAGLALLVGCSRTSLYQLEDPEPYEPSGGVSSGGAPTGGQATGGAPTTGGVSTGGVATGGSAFGGVGFGGAAGSPVGGAAGAGAAGGGLPPGPLLLGRPLVFAPTARSFGLNAVLAAGSPDALYAFARRSGTRNFTHEGTATSPTADVREWSFGSLAPGTEYDWRVVSRDQNGETEIATGRVVTQRQPGSEFTFALLSDSHIPPRENVPLDLSTENSHESVLLAVSQDIAASRPDFMVNLGDMLDFHLFGFNEPPPDSVWTRLAYLNYRRLFSDTLASTPHFAVIGNWDGENGCNGEVAIERSRSQRLLYVPGPSPETYESGGSVHEDYYAFTWGDALFVVLNVMTYTPTCHLLGSNPGVADDWTLGGAQLEWLEETLAAATSKWRFILIHHAVGGKAGDEINSAYGRGGGQAARVGEQALVHDLMLEYGVQIFFYGHDHVFTDMIVEGIHYTLPGSAGAPWKFTTLETGYLNYWPDSGHARVHVSPDAVEVSFLALGGGLLHSYRITE